VNETSVTARTPAPREQTDESVLEWLLDGDPGIRWQVMRDLVDADARAVDAERARVAYQGWGARLLSLQDRDGQSAGALYSPKWTSTTYTLLLLHWLGLPSGHPQALAACQALWDGARCFDGGLNPLRFNGRLRARRGSSLRRGVA
jgi:hypothetical protein